MRNDPLSHGLWEKTAPAAPPTEPLIGDVRADVVVVGCGYTGLSAALRLAEAGAKVAALEAVEVGFGGAGRNVGLVNAGMWVLPADVIGALGVDYGERALALLGAGPAAVWETIEKHAIDCEPVHNGTLHCAVGRAGAEEVAERARQWGARGAPVKALSAAEAAKRVGSTAFSGALLDMRAGTIQPLGYARGLARAAMAAGAAIYTGTPVERRRADGRRLDGANRARLCNGGVDRGRDRRLWRRALAAAAPRADPSALFQCRYGAIERRASGVDPAWA